MSLPLSRGQEWLVGHPVIVALGLSLGTSLGASLARFSYALFVPAMRDDLAWSYLVLGALNTAHAAGYLLGALTLSMVIRRFSSGVSFVAGGILTSVFLGLCGFVADAYSIALLRFLSGFTSASVFAGGTVLIAQLAGQHAKRSGHLLGIYYAGGGFGMVISAFLVPATLVWGLQWQWPHPWQLGWLMVGLTGLIMTLLMWKPSLSVPAAPPRSRHGDTTSPRRYVGMGAGYFCFGMGYIGYMTFVISLLRELGWSPPSLTLFYACMGTFGMFSAPLWAKSLDTFKGGQCLAIINGLLALACLIPAYLAMNKADGIGDIGHAAIYVSGAIFGACLATAVASTTAFVKHNLPQTQWIPAITVFTSIFAVGQMIGPALTGWVSDGSGGLQTGFGVSALVLLLGAACAAWQKPLN
ncbi:YbfB/YjiJ family MFS transporter [Limnohabitans sp. Rim8]|uniref:YbfB/YjiJ family MFS transporter n=1 Tax=Limnohabitans sp. Rim8 TaxID=1100718 RepID=UPI00262CBB26|nr:YbfB/YjiJ family MFS transporter [Limnohabitans sp. Rim8]